MTHRQLASTETRGTTRTAKRVALLTPPLSETARSFEKSTRAMWRSADNFGNCLFRYAISTHLVHYDWVGEDADPAWLRDNFDVICVPLANFLNPWAYGWVSWKVWLSDLIKACKLPVIAVGMGAQAPYGADANLALLPETIACARTLAAHCETIGVRGAFSASVLDKIGIRNVSIIGCPSHFIAGDQHLGVAIEQSFFGLNPRRLAVSGDDPKLDAEIMAAQRKLVDLIGTHGGFYVCQAPESLAALGRQRLGEVSVGQLREFNRHLAPDLTLDGFLDLVRRHFLTFTSVEAWLEFLQSCDLYLGMRVHGAIAAMQAGIPSIAIAHDARTRELCETIKVPHCTLADFNNRPLAELCTTAGFAGREFDRNRAELGAAYRKIFSDAGVECRLAFMPDADAPSDGVRTEKVAAPRDQPHDASAGAEAPTAID